MINAKKIIRNKLILTTLIIIEVGLLSSCQSQKQPASDTILNSPPVIVVPIPDLIPVNDAETGAAKVTQCKSPRLPMCTREYRPVCATRDTGVHCVTMPCSSGEVVTKSNACTACADEKVSSYIEGACQ